MYLPNWSLNLMCNPWLRNFSLIKWQYWLVPGTDLRMSLNVSFTKYKLTIFVQINVWHIYQIWTSLPLFLEKWCILYFLTKNQYCISLALSFFARQDFELTQHTVHTYMIMAFDCALLLHEVMYQLSVPCEILSRQNTSTQQLSSQPDSRCCNIYSWF